jgi:hypothetical protein
LKYNQVLRQLLTRLGRNALLLDRNNKHCS